MYSYNRKLYCELAQRSRASLGTIVLHICTKISKIPTFYAAETPALPTTMPEVEIPGSKSAVEFYGRGDRKANEIVLWF